jgi:hypothetical protein
MDPRQLKMWVKLATVAIGLAITIWSLRAGPLLGGGSGASSPGGIVGNGINGACREQAVAAQLSGASGTTASTLSTAGLSGGARSLLEQLDGNSLRCPKQSG